MGSNLALGEQCYRLGPTGCHESQVAGHLLNLFLQASPSIILFIPLNNPVTEVLELSLSLFKAHAGRGGGQALTQVPPQPRIPLSLSTAGQQGQRRL